MLKKDQIDKLKYNSNNLIPCIIQDYETQKVLKLVYLNKNSIELFIKKTDGLLYLNNRNEIFSQDERTGEFQEIKNIGVDRDQTTLLIEIEKAKDENSVENTFNKFSESSQSWLSKEKITQTALSKLYEILSERFIERPEKSYSTYLYEKGLDKILKKIGEEATEVIIAAKNKDQDEVINEIADLLYHILVMMVNEKIPLEEPFKILQSRAVTPPKKK